MEMLVISIAALYGGLLILPLIRQRPHMISGLDGYVVVTIGGLVGLHLIPHSIETGGGFAVLALLVGLLLPSLIERGQLGGEGEKKVERWIAPLALVALCIHVFIDGAALAISHDIAQEVGHAHEHAHEHGGHEEENASLLAFGVALHRLPLGLLIAWKVVPRWGIKAALWLVNAIVGVTLLGFYLGSEGLPMFSSGGLAITQALVAGALLHVVFDHHMPTPEFLRGDDRRAAGFGGLLGILTLGLIGMEHVEGIGPWNTLLALAEFGGPALLLGLLGVKIWSKKSKRGGFSFFDYTMSWLLFGVSVACFVTPMFHDVLGEWSVLTSFPEIAEIPLFALLGGFVFVPVVGAIPILLSLVHEGLSLGAALAFLLVSSAIRGRFRGSSVTFYGRESRRVIQVVWIFVACLVGWAVSVVFPHFSSVYGLSTSLFGLFSVAILGVFTTATLLRIGPRGIIRVVTGQGCHTPSSDPPSSDPPSSDPPSSDPPSSDPPSSDPPSSDPPSSDPPSSDPPSSDPPSSDP